MRSRTAAALLALVAAAVVGACDHPIAFLTPGYEYEEDLTLGLDGSATLVVNASVPALVALHHLPLEDDRPTRVDALKTRVRDLYSSPYTQVLRVSTWTRYGRRFVGVRLRVPDVRALPRIPAFSWATYDLAASGDQIVYRQRLSTTPKPAAPAAPTMWKGDEIIAFRLHLPARIRWHNSRDFRTDAPRQPSRGNILTWEQRLSDRFAGKPIAWSDDHQPDVMEVRMDRQSILYRTLWLFAIAFLAAVAAIAGLIWLAIRRAPRDPGSSALPHSG
jgi:hypothetical protein